MPATVPDESICAARSAEAKSNTGIVVIGRNEGQRLAQCLNSLPQGQAPVVYVDSASTDDSVKLGRDHGTEVVELSSGPLSAARSRNAGFQRVMETYDHVQYVQFIDGDCQLNPAWLHLAHAVMAQRPDVAIVCGRLRERHPERSIYNHFCELEWNVAPGEVESTGGIFLARAAAIAAVGGFNEGMIAGEEPELCYRLRQTGWRILRLNAEMATHDASIVSFSQWWRRCVRAGYAYAQGAAISHGGYWHHETSSIWLWGFAMPAFFIAALALLRPLAVLILVAYAALALRVYRSGRRRGFSTHDSRLFTSLCVLAKFPQGIGVLRHVWYRLRGRTSNIIEYK